LNTKFDVERKKEEEWYKNILKKLEDNMEGFLVEMA